MDLLNLLLKQMVKLESELLIYSIDSKLESIPLVVDMECTLILVLE